MVGSVEEPDRAGQPSQLVGLSAVTRLPILAVDDRPDNLVALEAVLAPLGFEVISVASGEEALRLLLERDFALILLDVRMPGLDGIETARMIKARDRSREVPIVFLTASRDEVSDMVRGYDVGAVDYVMKPFDEELLRSKVAVFAELEHRRAALKHSEEILRGAFDGAPIGKTLLGPDRTIVRANPAFAGLVAADEAALAGLEIAELCHPDDWPALSVLLDRTSPELQSRGGDHAGLGADIRLITFDRHEVWVSPTASWITGSERTAPLLLVQWVDVNARRRDEQSRAELLIEQAARAQAEAQAGRLEKLQRLLEALEAARLDELLAEVARRLAEMFDADSVEVQVDEGGNGEPIRFASGARARLDPSAEPSRGTHAAPLQADGMAIGVIRVALPHARAFTPLEQALLRDAANHVSLLVRRMQLHEREHRIATELQQGLLPTRLPQLPGVELAADCQAAGLAAEVGGDWYDVFLLPGDRLGIVIGDVTGSGIHAASAMGHLRSVTRAFALGDAQTPSPAAVLTRLHRYHQQAGVEQLFTILYLVLDRAAGTITWANAGHPPPLVRSRDGGVRTLEGSQSLMSLQDEVYRDHQAPIEDGDTLVLYTDGLVERRHETFDAGLERLRGAIRAGPDDPVSLCSFLVESSPPHDGEGEDDVTALVAKIGARAAAADGVGEQAEAPRIEATIASDANAPALARRLLERSFGEALDPGELETAKLAVSELTTNAVVHGTGEITLLADLDDTRLMVGVLDQGAGFEYVPRDPGFESPRGRGLMIVGAETSRWGVREGPTHVWFEIERGG